MNKQNSNTSSSSNTTPNANNPYISNTANKMGYNNGYNTNTTQNQNTNGLFANPLNNQNNTQRDFIVGALIGAAASFILTNENAQKALLKGFAKISSLFEMGIEELKERYEDAKAEVNS